jgi:hypothetical protein
VEGGSRERVDVLRDPAAALGLVLLDPGDLLLVDAVGVVHETLAVGEREHLATQLAHLLRGVRGHVAGA